MEWSIQEIAKLAGTTSRTLRHYDDTGLVPPSRVGANGYRYYDADALVRLQRVLLLRELGLGIPAIAALFNRESLAGERDEVHALTLHLTWLREEQRRLDRQIASVESTIDTLKGGEKPMAENMFDGFDHTQYKEEVEERWGKDAYAKSDQWWRKLSADEKSAFFETASRLGADWIEAAQRDVDPASDEAQALAQRQFHWLRGIPGTPGGGHGGPTKEYFTGLGEMYVADPRFAKNYGGEAGAAFVRDAMRVYAERNL
ncbi:MerR family transcriptional regulator [Pseudolysinimonas yzui]|uniref:MerR family transcriptional regulator n=1 Tax=Pseudolysinimonas yzui TaxID=2708254 RepID=A0A8J3M2A8_9MICO|nr:MerR family transcriptional regulator [Pseudolysinimonas yzui]GHF22382.1 MerR family transcriptional regulator [Pseudolysinimonas yzui]